MTSFSQEPAWCQTQAGNCEGVKEKGPQRLQAYCSNSEVVFGPPVLRLLLSLPLTPDPPKKQSAESWVSKGLGLVALDLQSVQQSGFGSWCI